MSMLGKHILFKSEWYDKYKEYDCTWTTLRRMNRETKSQLISDTQRIPVDWSAKPWVLKHFQITAKRYKKNKLFLPDGSFSDYYGKTTLIETDITPMISDTPFEEMFRVAKGATRETIWDYEIVFMNKLYSILKYGFKKPKPICCLDTEHYIGKHLNEVFNLPVYYVNRIWFDDIGEHFRAEFKKSCNYDRNLIFHQVTSCGGDLKLISNENNENNDAIFIWVFKDKIVYKTSDGRSEW